ncbi:unnamed protein product [Sympodiomycopsis kandeliae]
MSSSSSEASPFLSFLRVKPYTPPSVYHLTPEQCAGLDLQSQPTWYESLSTPRSMANPEGIGYGGYAISFCIFTSILQLENSNDASDKTGFVLYSAQGTYLRPAFNERNFIAKVQTIRKTRTFRTQEVKLYQPSKSSKETLDLCMMATIDFMAAAPSSKDPTICQYQDIPTPPQPDVAHHTSLQLTSEAMKDAPKEFVQSLTKLFAPMLDMFNTKYSTDEGLWGENLFGALKEVETSQHHLKPTQKRAYDWFSSKGHYKPHSDEQLLPYSCYAANIAMLGWIMDAFLSFTPLAFTNHFLDDVKACASLDFSMRVHQQEDIGFISQQDSNENPWFLRECKTHVSAHERTYSEAQLWRDITPSSANQQRTNPDNLKCIATMTQASVLKSWPEKKESKL